MTKRNTYSKIATLIGAGIITLAAGSAAADNRNWMNNKSAASSTNTADIHHAMAYGAAY